MVAILLMSAKMNTLGLFKIKVFTNKGYESLSHDSNFIVDVVM